MRCVRVMVRMRVLLGAQIPEGDASLLDGDALRRSVSSLGEVSYEVVETSADGEHATVRASYTLEGSRQHTDFRLHRSGTHWGFLISGLLMRRLCRR